MGPSRLANSRFPLPVLTRQRRQDTAQFREPTTVQTECFQPNLTMGLSRGGQAVATSIAFVAIAGATVATRVFIRLYLVSNWGADDALVVCSLVMSIAVTILIKLRMPWSPFAGTYGYLTYTHLRRGAWSRPAFCFSRAGGVSENAQGNPFLLSYPP